MGYRRYKHISKAGGMPNKNVLLSLLRVMKRDLIVIRMMSPVLVIQRKKGGTVCEEKKAIIMQGW